MLEFENIDYSFQKGVDQKTDPRLLKQPYCLVLENATAVPTGGWRIRNGYSQLQNLSTADGMFIQNQELVALTDTNVQAYSTASGTFSSKGSFDKFQLGYFTVSAGASTQTQPFTAAGNSGQIFTVWSDLKSGSNNTIQAKITDQLGTTVASQIQIAAVGSVNLVQPQVFAMSDRWAILYQRADNNHVLFRTILYTDATHTPSAATDLGVMAPFYGSYTSLNDKILIGYVDGSNNPRGSYCSTTGVLTATANFTTDAGGSISRIFTNTRSKAGNPENLFLYVLSGTIKIATTDNTMAAVIPATLIDNTTSNLDKPVGTFDGSVWQTYWEDKGGGSETTAGLIIKNANVTTAGTVSSLTTLLLNRSIASGPVKIGSAIYFTTFKFGTYPAYESVTGTTSLRLVATLVKPDVTMAVPDTIFMPALSGTNLYVLPQMNTDAGFRDSNFNLQPNISVFTLTNAVTPSADALNKNLWIATGNKLIGYDGTAVQEAGFPIPDNIISTSLGGAGITGTFLYKYTYTFIDNQGVLFESTPSNPSASVSPSNQTVTINVRTLKITDKASNKIKIDLYRTANNGTTYYLVQELDNNTAVDTIAFTDAVTDTVLTARTQLYTNGNVLGNDPLPSGCYITKVQTSNNRLFAAGDPRNPSRVYFSQVGLPASFPSVFFLDIRPDDGDFVTGFAKMDEYIIVFKQRSFYLITGTGPDSTGNNNDFAVRRIATDVGCSGVRSIVEDDSGAYFQSLKGICHITRDFKVKYVGFQVEPFSGSTINSAVLYPDFNEVRFALSTGEILVFNYLIESWSVFTGFNALSLVILNSLMYHQTTAGVVHQERRTGTLLGTPADINDNGKPIKFRIKTCWMYGNIKRTLKRIRRVALTGNYNADSVLTVGFHYDYIDGVDQSVSLLSSTLGNYGVNNYGDGNYGGNTGIIDLRSKMARQKCEAIALDISSNILGSLFTFDGVSIEMSDKGHLKQVASA